MPQRQITVMQGDTGAGFSSNLKDPVQMLGLLLMGAFFIVDEMKKKAEQRVEVAPGSALAEIDAQMEKAKQAGIIVP